MTTNWIFISLLCCGFINRTSGLFREILFPSKDTNLLIEEYVRQNDYPFELHYVTTADGYILSLHRIPSNVPTRNAQNNAQRVVLIMHGLLGASTDWIVTGKNRSLAFLLADNGYDVWLGNSRGTTNSKNHTVLSIRNQQFWDFSWHEMGIYDLPAMIDYILAQTGQQQLFYVGFSQGTTQFWVLMSLLPQYNEKIKLMFGLAPVAYTGHISGLLRLLSYFANMFRGLYKYVGYFEMLSSSPIEKLVAYLLCRQGLRTQAYCELLISSIEGFSNEEIDHAHLVDYLQVTPAGCSYKQLIHYAMLIQNPGHFRPYDYGTLTNLRRYGQLVPPEYPLRRATAPVVLYHGLHDYLAHPKDVEMLDGILPNIVERHTVTEKPLAHFDFLFGVHIRTLVYDYLIEKMNSIP